MNLKILCVTQRFFPAIGGAEQVAERFMDFLSQRHQITVFTTNALDLNSFWDEEGQTVKNDQNKNYKIKRYEILVPNKVPKDLYSFPLSIASPGPFCPDMWKDLLNLEDKFDLIVATAFPYNHIIPAFLAAKKYETPIIVIPHLHLEFPELYLTGLRLALLSKSDAIVVNTNAEKNALLKFNILQEKIHVIPPSIDIKNQENSTNLRQALNINKDSIMILFSGTKSHAKGTIDLVEAVKLLLEKNDNIELVLIGHSMNDFKKYIQNLEKKYLKRIHDLGTVSNEIKWNAFSSCDMFVLPSKSESFGISYLEAWKYKKPIIGCNIDAVKDLVDEEINGLLVDFGDIGQLAISITRLFDPALRAKLGENGYRKLIEKYDSKKLCENFEGLCLTLQS